MQIQKRNSQFFYSFSWKNQISICIWKISDDLDENKKIEYLNKRCDCIILIICLFWCYPNPKCHGHVPVLYEGKKNWYGVTFLTQME
jgi:hypothetical protein